MNTTYNVRIWKIEVCKGVRGTTYKVRWRVDRKAWKKSFQTKALAGSFHAELLSAARKGEAFDTTTGLPVTRARITRDMSWYDFACAFADIKWPRVAATTRRTHAEALTKISMAMLTTDRGRPNGKVLRAAMCRWAFNTNRRDSADCPDTIRAALEWAARHSRPVSSLRDPEVLRVVLDGLTVKLDGSHAAPSVATRMRKIFNTAVEYAVELELLDANPIPALKWTQPRTSQAVDRRRVANPVQVRTLLGSVRAQQRSGPRLVAYFGCLYFAALRPEEAAGLTKHNLSLPADGWGELHLERAEPHAGKEWTDTGNTRDQRQLKQRARGDVRTVPCPPELTALLHEHLAEFGTAPDGRLFFGERNHSELPKLTIVRAWRRAREAAFTEDAAASPLAKRPYDLRHAAVSTWLNGGVPPTTVAEWAGHSVEVLLKTYAKCLDGGDAAIRHRVQAALGHYDR